MRNETGATYDGGNPPQNNSGIRDNYRRSSVGDFLREKMREGSRLSIVSAYFTIYAFDALKDKLSNIEDMRFLFGEPRFIHSLDPDRTDRKAFKIEDEGLSAATVTLSPSSGIE